MRSDIWRPNVRQLRNDGDERQTGFGVHCGGSAETRDHAPSRILLDEPYPENLPILPCCERCNQGFSDDEAYLAGFIECVVCGSTEEHLIKRPKIRQLLSRQPLLRQRIQRSKKEADTIGGSKIIVWEPEDSRIQNVVVKLARCHAAFELNEPQLHEPDHVMSVPLMFMNDEQREHFEDVPDSGGWPEVGSRAMQRLIIADEVYAEGWITVQMERYRYMAIGAGNVVVRGVLSEYLAYEVIWD